MKLFKNKQFITHKKMIHIISFVVLVFCAVFLLHYLIFQPYSSKKTMDKYRDIYYSSFDDDISESETFAYDAVDSEDKNTSETTSYNIELNGKYTNGEKNKKGILKKFTKLLSYNSDVKGWLSIEGTDIDYPVMQNNTIDYYLDRDFEKNYDKNGSLYIDEHCCIEQECKNIVIHGHNMKTTHMMFYDLNNYDSLSYYKEHPVITFDTLYEESKWKIISFMKLYGDPSKMNGFNYMKGNFESDDEFLEFIYQIRIRSIYYCPVTINENDSVLMLSTCSGALNDGRMVLVARKIRPDEDTTVNTSAAYNKNDTLYPDEWYRDYGGSKPQTSDFATASLFNGLDWYDGEIEYSISGRQIEDDNYVFEFIDESHAKIIKIKNGADPKSAPEIVYYKDHEFEIVSVFNQTD